MKIFLASKSERRRSLLKKTKLRFKVLEPKVKEEKEGLPQNVVILNSFKKAMWAAKRIKEGLIISADTIVYCNKRIFTKPKNRLQAFKALKILTENPHEVFTGLTLIKKEKKNLRILTDFEKTKVYMDKLKNSHLKAYLKKEDFKAWAGGFNVEEKGSLFIKRVEGCFYNVVGLPLNKLRKMLEKFSINILIILLVLCLGCVEFNPVTLRKEIVFISEEKEFQIGLNLAKAIEKQFKIIKNPTELKRLNSILKRLSKVQERKTMIFYIDIIDKKEINAFTIPGGHIYVFSGLLDFVKDEDELAYVLAHEIAHQVARHPIKKLESLLGINILQILSSRIDSPEFVRGLDLALASILSAYSIEDEFLADSLAIKYLKKAGFNPEKSISFLKRLQKEESKKIRPLSYFRTHPYITQRITNIKKILKLPLSFEDLVNE